ncbi:MAG: TM1812 family CRISPR-associated protein, partial [Leptotrichiaceae bacterium]|nr:TM1812 family CRISPR-associated protein [Leptotrichiaceae bacterium]
MKRGLFILNLTNEIEKKQNRNYIFEGGKYENKYQIEVLFKENDFDKVICFGTPQSSWDYLYNQMYIKFFNKEADKEDLEYLREIREVETVKELFYKYFKDKIIIKYFDKDLEKNEMINYIYELKEEMLYSETIYIDITGGKRDLPIFIIQLLNLIINKENRKINVKIFYSKENENKEFEIISLDDIIEKLDYTNEISLFSKYGNPAKFIKHLIDEKLAEKLSSLYICTQYNLIKSIKTVMEEIKQMKKIYTVFIQEKVVETKINAWKEMLDSENPLINYQWQLSNFALAIVAKSENNQKKGIKNQEITDLRHNIVHAYDRKNLNYNEIEKVENSLRKENKVEEILVTNIGLARNYKKIKYKYDNHETDETYFAFSNILKYKKYSKVVLLGTCNEDWNTFIDKWIEE